MELKLQNHRLPHGGWQQSGNLFVAGYGHFDEWPLRASDLERVLRECEGPEELKQLMASLTGCFAFVYKDRDKVVAAVDLCRSIPLFFSSNAISDTLSGANLIIEEFEKLPYIEFVQNDNTLIADWKQLKAGHFLWADAKNSLEQVQYFDHHRSVQAIAENALYAKVFTACIAKMQKRLVDTLDGRLAVVPLSGGFDSRFILSMLVSADYPRIKAFTYGRRDGHEAQIAEQVCKSLGVDWQFIDYTEERYQNALDEHWDDYLLYAGNATSVPQEQEYFAVQSLVDELDPDAVFLPGFCGDVQAGSFIPDVFFEKRWFKEPVTSGDYLLGHLSRLPTKDWLAHVTNEDVRDLDFEEFYAQIEEWVLMEREAKYIINGVRCYEYFGFSWMLPLWDRDFIEFWQKVPMSLRRDRKLYREVLDTLFFKPNKIDIKSKHFDARFSSGSWQSWLRYVLPKGVKNQAKKLLIPSKEVEINNLNTFRDLLADKGDIPIEDETPVNEVMGKYYLQLLKLKREGK